MVASRDIIRIPNLPVGQIVDKNGNPTDDELTFRQALITSLQRNFGNEGIVAPTQDATNITAIQNNQLPDPVTGIPNQYSCAYGTFLYDSSTNTMRVAIDNGAGAPIFKTLVLI